ncbi:GNAT family N-acetyltransferase [Planotetraspora phitsanulokensis]|uniref:Acetyltransferase n=1 Tax=Planotetraspora phitsanulokensis TaxID=575192 RepID=A0A8J3XG90_9ACTN|nr:GNAT family N-acetyltransferase [Planotetraspora phitsanulokensis]GII35313.1 acetyltransferase [Planotetraspora phitsanulokensis]
MIQLRRVGPDRFIAALDTVLTIYAAAMRPPPDQLPGRLAIMRNHATYPEFVCMLAEAPEIVAFAYGFHGTEGQWWHDVVRRALRDRAGAPVAEQWFGDALEIAEVHVHPDHQGKGIGRRMIHGLCEGRSERTAVLSTHDAPTAARHLYRDIGFVDLMTEFVFPGGYEDYAIAGARLPLPPPVG